jgi:hypothetical protein
MFSFSTIFSMLSAAPQIIAELEQLAASPGVVALENALGLHFTMVTTPGAAAVVEPKSPTVGK